MKVPVLSSLALGILLTNTTPILAQSEDNVVSLTQVARANGYVYNYVGADDAVILSKGALVIYVRPGNQLYDVGDRSIAIEGPIPETMNGDVYVSNMFARKLKQYSMTTTATKITKSMMPKMKMASKSKTMNSVSVMKSNTTPTPMASVVAMTETTNKETSPVTNLTAAQSKHDQTIDVTGMGEPNSTVNITLTALIAKGIPRVTVSRRSVKTQSDGSFAMTLPVTNAYFTNAILEINAEPSDNDGTIKPTVATVILQRMQEKTDTPADHTEK